MPELPEVEFVARALDQLLTGRTITTSLLLREKLAPQSTPKDFKTKLGVTKINHIHRRGKHILFDLDNGKTLITHLRMTGRFMLLDADREDPKFTHAVFYLDDESRLVFQDQRHFGFMKIVDTAELANAKEIRKLAPEPFSEHFTHDYLHAALKRSSRNLKEFIIDQSKVSGLGNIYAAEAMFFAGINPRRRANSLSKQKTKKLFDGIIKILQMATSNDSKLKIDPENIEGSYYSGGRRLRWNVYDREHLPCNVCRTAIRRIKQGSRSTYYCPRCQKQ